MTPTHAQLTAIAAVIADSINAPWPGRCFNEVRPLLLAAWPEIAEDAAIRCDDAAGIIRDEERRRRVSTYRVPAESYSIWNFLSHEVAGVGQRWLDMRECIRNSMSWSEYTRRWTNPTQDVPYVSPRLRETDL